jgi:hypothetical protein
MITAKEARELVEQSEVAMTRRMDQIGEKIREAAMLGKREMWMTSALPYHKEFEVEDQPYRFTPEFTPLQRLIEKELSQQGFAMRIVEREVMIGGGLGSMEEGRQEKRPYLLVTW